MCYRIHTAWGCLDYKTLLYSFILLHCKFVIMISQINFCYTKILLCIISPTHPCRWMAFGSSRSSVATGRGQRDRILPPDQLLLVRHTHTLPTGNQGSLECGASPAPRPPPRRPRAPRSGASAAGRLLSRAPPRQPTATKKRLRLGVGGRLTLDYLFPQTGFFLAPRDFE